MREHQIVITLKPDQFLEVQRLARAANAKSMGVFVRQKLLAALGIEGAAAGGEEQLPGQALSQGDLDAILADLQRVHGELKAFVAESLSPYSPEAFGQIADDPAVQADQFAYEQEDPAVLQAVAEVEAAHNDDLEKVAERTFAISPRLGAIGEPGPQQQTHQQPSLADTKNLLSRHELHSRRDLHRYHHAPEHNDELDQPFEEEPPVIPPVVPSMQRPENDPLAKLLTSEEMISKPIPKVQPIDEDDDAFDVPLSIAERRRMLAGETEPVFQEPPHPALQPTLPSELGSVQPESNQQEAHAQPQFDDQTLTSDPSPAETGSATASQPIPSPQNDLGRPLGYPPLSGSPPPKRRQV